MPENKNIIHLPLLVTKSLFVMPNKAESIEAARSYSKEAIRLSREGSNSLILVGVQKDEKKKDITADDIYEAATLCRLTSFSESGEAYRVRLIGSRRVKLISIIYENDSFYAEGEVIENTVSDPSRTSELVKKIVNSALLGSKESLRDAPRINLSNDEIDVSLAEQFADALSGNLPFTREEKANLILESDLTKRLEILLEKVDNIVDSKKIDDNIENQVRERAERSQKEYYLREKMKVIKDELGESGTSASDEDKIRKKLEENPYPENVKSKVLSELRRFDMMPDSSLESSLIMNYIETLMNVPWYQKTEDNDDLDNVQKILDEDHYGLKKVKERIIEYLAVKHQTGNLKAPILCFYGPPGCGKTSLAKSIARALGRKFFKASLGGVSDESEIRGHRRTYVGSMPGRIISGMTKSGTINPVFLLDEIDKVGGQSYHGDPSSALLEVLDPEQNVAFNDNYIEEPYDLSNVLFIATANYLENVPAPLRDRLELIEVPSYTELEKIKIADGFLIRKQMAANGLKEGDITFKEEAIKEIIESYTAEAGVRQLERLIASICRKVIVDILRKPSTELPIVIDAKKVNEYLGVPIFEDTKKEKEPQVGVVTGLAYTEFGGDILPIEVNYFSGKGGLSLTGKLGDVMKESCAIALDYVRANADKYGIDSKVFETNDIHIHVPDGAVPKDGPSAGVAITCAIVSCLTHRPIDNNVAMTGEVTLRGKARPIGGLREKSLAALRSGIKTIIVPEENKKDVGELPDEVKKDLKIVYMKCVDDALSIALMK